MSTVEATLPPNVGTAGGSPSPAPAAEDKKKAEPRPYVVLRKIAGTSPNSPQTWELVASIDATSAEQAIRKAAETPGTSFLNPDGPTTLVAVPSRSFNPVTVAVQTSTQIILT